ncbi:MAG: hypothetical protein ACJ72A_10310 [Nocardioidaceae bacterium]
MTSARLLHLVPRALRKRPLLRLGLPALAATLVAGAAVGVAIGQDEPEKPVQKAIAIKPMTVKIDPADSPFLAARVSAFSRSAKRVTLKEKPKVTDHLWRTAPLNLWPEPREHGKPLAVLPEGGQVAVTGVRRAGFARILHHGLVRWVNADYLAEEKPKPPKPAPPTGTLAPSSTSSSGSSSSSSGSSSPSAPSSRSSAPSPAPEAAPSASSPDSGGPCPSGSSVESGIVPQAVALHRAVCAHFPQITEYGGYRGDGEHSDGHAIDVMVYNDSGTGQAVADWLRANAATLHIDDIIWAQHIWTTQRGSEGWRSMPDRGSVTANHYDHVHVRVF